MKKPSNFDFVSKILKDASKDSYHFVWEKVTIFDVVTTVGPFRRVARSICWSSMWKEKAMARTGEVSSKHNVIHTP